VKKPPLVLGIAGSPRRHGNSDSLLDAALRGAEGAGARTRRLIASAANLRPCLGCNACSLTGECVQHDGGPDVYAAIDDADAIIVASPVFFATVPGVLKVLYDRMQPYWARRFVLKQPLARRRPGGILLVRAGGDSFGFSGASDATKSVFAVLGIDCLGEVLVEGADSAGELVGHADVLAEAEALGREVALEAERRLRAGS